MKLEKVSVACIGTTEAILMYNAIGFKTFYSTDYQMIDKQIFKLFKAGYKIIFVTDEVYKNITTTLEKYQDQTYPIIIPIPLDDINQGIGMNKIKANVEKAIGINIF